MASPFQRYQSGIEASTGNLVPAYGQMAAQTANALAGLGQSIGQGIQLYAENQRKSEAADATIASGIARFKSIADVYAQDPEFAPIVAQFAQRLEQYKDAPNQSYAKKAVMANEINMLGQELGQSIQAYQVVRGRQIERVGSEILSQFPNVEKVTDPAVIREGTSKFNTGKDFMANESEFITGLNKFRDAAKAAGKEIKGSDAEALDAYRRDVLDSTNKAMSAGTLDKGIGSRIIEQVEAQRSIEKKNAQAKSDMPVLPSMAKSSRKDYEAVTGTAYQAPEQVDVTKFAPTFQEGLKKLTEAANKEKAQASEKSAIMAKVGSSVSADFIKEMMDKVESGQAVTKDELMRSLIDIENKTNPERRKQSEFMADFSGFGGSYGGYGSGFIPPKVSQSTAVSPIAEAINKLPQQGNSPVSASDLLGIYKSIAPKVDEFKKASEKMADTAKKIASGQAPTQETQPVTPPAPVLSLGKMNVGQVEYERKVNQAEKKAKIADLLTQRIGIVDPVTGKKSLPAGFDAYYKKMVPESDARVIDVDGIKLFWDGSKLEQVKMEQPKVPTAKEIGENSAFIFGVQTEKGLQPTELVPDSGILVGGIVSGSTAGAEKVREQLTDLIDLRSSISRLTAINDKFGEFASLRDQGISQYDLMKLRAVLTKQVNVSGSISDYERKEIAKMTPDPTAFLDFEPKTRAALLGIAQGIDRDIKTLATSRGLSVIMTGNSGMTQNQSLRQKYLSEKTK